MSTLSTADDGGQLTATVHRPLDKYGVPIIYDGNPAKMRGVLLDINDCCLREGYYQTILTKGAVAISNGRYAIDRPEATPFVLGLVTDLPVGKSYGFKNPCPPTASRIHKYDAASPKKVGDALIAGDFDAAIKLCGGNVVVNPDLVTAEKRSLGNFIIKVFKDADAGQALLERAGYDGCALIPLMVQEVAKATGQDKTLVTAQLTAFLAAPFGAEMTLSEFNLRYKEYTRLLAAAGKTLVEDEAIGLVNRWLYWHDHHPSD